MNPDVSGNLSSNNWVVTVPGCERRFVLLPDNFPRLVRVWHFPNPEMKPGINEEIFPLKSTRCISCQTALVGVVSKEKLLFVAFFVYLFTP